MRAAVAVPGGHLRAQPMPDVIVAELVRLPGRARHRGAVRSVWRTTVGAAPDPLIRECDRRGARPASARRRERLALDGRARHDRIGRVHRAGARTDGRGLPRQGLAAARARRGHANAERVADVRRHDLVDLAGADRGAGRIAIGAARVAAEPVVGKSCGRSGPRSGGRGQRLADEGLPEMVGGDVFASV